MRRKFTLQEIAENPELLSKVLAIVRASTGGADNRFDVNLAEGKVSEAFIKRILTGEETVEVKRDFKVSQTGNVAIEFECYGKPSGISSTQSQWYAIILDGERYEGQVAVFITTDRLKRLVNAAPGRIMNGGDNNASKFKLLNLERLLMEEESIQDYEDYVKWQRNKRPFRVKKQKD